MAMDSFYGGRQGASFVIVYRFDAIDIDKSGEQFRCKEAAVSNTNPDLFLWQNGNFVFKDGVNYNNYTWKYLSLDGGSVATTDGDHNAPEEAAEGMVQCFSQGGNSVDKVNYGEYVIIDTPYKDNPDNGKVFRRGMNFIVDPVKNPLAGAEYIGQIVGPKGDVPQIDVDHYDTIINTATSPVVSDEFNELNKDLIPGYEPEKEDPYNDEIKYVYTKIKDSYGNVLGILIGFKIPYLVIDYEARSIKPYENRGIDPSGKYYNYGLITKDSNFYDEEKDEWVHPFYHKWQIKIPHGYHGIDVNNLEVIPTKTMPRGFNNSTYPGAVIYNDIEGEDPYLIDGSLTVLRTSYDIMRDDLTLYKVYEKTALVNTPYGEKYIRRSDCYMDVIRYKETNYDNIEQGEPTYYIIGDANFIKRLTLSEDGTITAFYTAKPNPEVINENSKIRWIGTEGIKINEDGTVTVYYNTTHTEGGVQVHDTAVFEKQIDWITEVTLSQHGDFKVVYNNDTVIVGYDPETGEPIRDNEYKTQLLWIDKVRLENDGTLKFIYNNNTTTDFTIFRKTLKWINDIQIQNKSENDDDEGSGDQYVHVIYNTDDIQTIDDSNRVGLPLNYVVDAVVTVEGTAGAANITHSHLMVYYSDPTRRTSDISYPSPKLGKVVTGWTDLGPVRGEAGGIHIIKNVDSLDELKDENDNWIPPERITPADAEHAGWGVTHTIQDADPEILFYDYETEEWFSIGSLNSSAIDPSYIVTKSKAYAGNLPNPSDVTHLNANGFWFGTVEVKSVH